MTLSPDGATGEADGADRSVSFAIVFGVLVAREVRRSWSETAFTVPGIGISILDLLGDWVYGTWKGSSEESPGSSGSPGSSRSSGSSGEDSRACL